MEASSSSVFSYTRGFRLATTSVAVAGMTILCSNVVARADYTSPSPAASNQYGINYREALQQADTLNEPSALPRFGNLGGIGSSTLQTTSATAADSTQVPSRLRFSPAVEAAPPSSPAFTTMGGMGGVEPFSLRITQTPATAPPEVTLNNFGMTSMPQTTQRAESMGNFGFSNPLSDYGRTEHGGGFLKLDFENAIRMNR
ncbi:MAG TPA: hypothetical protein V6C76_08510 [Drouetiella sp.]